MGGWGTWAWISKSSERFAAAAPCGFPVPETGDYQGLVKLPIWGMAGGAENNGHQEDGAAIDGGGEYECEALGISGCETQRSKRSGF